MLPNVTSAGHNSHETCGIWVWIYVKLLRHTGQGKSQAPVVFQAYDWSDALCIVKNLQEYLHWTSSLRGDNTQSSYQKPHKPVTTDTIVCWLKNTLRSAGVAEEFSAYSTCAVVTSAAKRSSLALDQIMKCASWTNTSTFGHFYDKPCSSTLSFCESTLP